MDDQPREHDSVADLLRQVGRRAAPPPEDYRRVFAASRSAWQAVVHRRRRRNRAWALAAGLAALVVGGGALWQLANPQRGVSAGKLVIVAGGVFAGDTGGEDWRWLNQPDIPLAAGTRLRTDPTGRAALRIGAATSLRIDGSTDLLLQEAGRIELLAGRLYVDTHARHGNGHGGHVEIVTPLGTLRDVGTQFEVYAEPANLRIRTREGSVLLSTAASGMTIACNVSEELRIDTQGRIERGRILPHHEDWAWAQALAELPRAESLPLSRFLDWVARETGRRLLYDSPETEARVRKVVLHGTTPKLAPVQALEVTLATTDFDFTLQEDGAILLRRRQTH
jgi:ferric-dicitrate binding protein FerR (iron transport regulator)